MSDTIQILTGDPGTLPPKLRPITGIAGVRGELPLPAGATYVPLEGRKYGDDAALPPEIAAQAAAIRKQMEEADASQDAVRRERKPLPPVSPVDSSQLDPAHKAELDRCVREYQNAQSPATVAVAPLPCTPSAEDRLLYVTAVLGGQSLHKTYNFLQGRLLIVLRQPTTLAAEAALRQAAEDCRQEPETTRPALFYRRVSLYRTLLSLKTVSMDGTTTDVAAAVDAFLTTGGLSELLRHVLSQPPLAQEAIWRLCRDAYAKFDALLDALETEASDPDFS